MEIMASVKTQSKSNELGIQLGTWQSQREDVRPEEPA